MTLEKPERILWRPPEVEEFDAEFETILYIDRISRELEGFPPSDRVVNLRERLKLALSRPGVVTAAVVKIADESALKLSELQTRYDTLYKAYSGLRNMLEAEGKVKTSPAPAVLIDDQKSWMSSIIEWISIPAVVGVLIVLVYYIRHYYKLF